jgi:GntR family transcriptional repressor for pyruvate dehydrogenase complex
MLIARATGNAAIAATVEMLWNMRASSPEAALLLSKARAAKVQPVVAEHSAILEALRIRDPAAARAAMRAHLAQVMDHLLFAMEEVAVEKVRANALSTRHRFTRASAT